MWWNPYGIPAGNTISSPLGIPTGKLSGKTTRKITGNTNKTTTGPPVGIHLLRHSEYSHSATRNTHRKWYSFQFGAIIIDINENEINMKDLRTHLHEALGLGNTLGFTMDDELAGKYIDAFIMDKWEVDGLDLKDIELWWSLGKEFIDYVLKTSRFTGCLDETGDELKVYRAVDLDKILLHACDTVSNGDGGKNEIDEDWGHFVLCYKGHDPFCLTDLNYNDWDDYKYAINPRANWRNCISKTNLEWIMWEDENTIWIRNRSSYPSLFKYTGWSIWKDGKCEFGKLAISK